MIEKKIKAYRLDELNPGNRAYAEDNLISYLEEVLDYNEALALKNIYKEEEEELKSKKVTLEKELKDIEKKLTQNSVLITRTKKFVEDAYNYQMTCGYVLEAFRAKNKDTLYFDINGNPLWEVGEVTSDVKLKNIF